jgi:hypothetical protein
MSENDFECFANTGVNPCKRYVRAHEYAISTSHLVHAVVLRDAQADWEKSTCLAMTVRAIAHLAGQGQTMGHRRGKAVVRPPSPRILVAEIGSLSLFIPAEEVLAHKTSQPLGHRRGTSGSPSFATIAVQQEILVGQNQKQKRRLYAKRKCHAIHSFARSRCLGI